jgi:hypothetical protein
LVVDPAPAMTDCIAFGFGDLFAQDWIQFQSTSDSIEGGRYSSLCKQSQ